MLKKQRSESKRLLRRVSAQKFLDVTRADMPKRKRPDVNERSKLVRFLLERVFWGLMSACQAQATAHAALADIVDRQGDPPGELRKLASLGNGGVSPACTLYYNILYNVSI